MRLRVLTPRQRQIVFLLPRGLTNLQIAQQLGIAEQTVKNHLHKASTVLGIHNRLGLALLAIRAGLRPAAGARKNARKKPKRAA